MQSAHETTASHRSGFVKLLGDFLNPRNELFRERGMKENPPPRDEAIRLMSENPNLIRRPLLVKGGKVLFGFDEEVYREALK